MIPVRQNTEIIDAATRSLISMRYKTITKAVNKEFWNSISDTAHSRYVGSYGRGTAISVSDLDVLVELPQNEFVLTKCLTPCEVKAKDINAKPSWDDARMSETSLCDKEKNKSYGRIES